MESQAIEKSGNDGVKLALHHYPAAAAKAQAIVVHGYGEHAGRYAEVAETLVQAGYDVLAPDLRGHGRSGGPRGHIEQFSQLLDDADVVFAEAQRLRPDVPRFLIGHSFGGLIALLAIEQRSLPAQLFAGLVLSSPFLRLKLAVPGWKVGAARIASVIYPRLALPSGLSGAAVARDRDIAARYDVDPLNGKAATARWYVETMDAQERAFADASRVTLPTLLLHGEADQVADPARSAEIFPRLGASDKTLELITGAYHEIFNEPPDDRRRIIGRVVAWLDAHLTTHQ